VCVCVCVFVCVCVCVCVEEGYMLNTCQIITNSVCILRIPLSSKYGLPLGEMEANRPCGPNSRSLVFTSVKELDASI